MAKEKRYSSPEAFRAALEIRIKKFRNPNESLELARRKVSFEAFLMRVMPSKQQVVLKGGFALHLRYDARVRPTKDLDAAIHDPGFINLKSTEVQRSMREVLEKIAAINTGDFFSFVIGESSTDLGLGREFIGFRYPVKAQIGSRLFDSFHIDLTVGDAVILPFDQLQIGQCFEFAGFDSKNIPVIRAGQHFAEKLHSLCRDRGNKENNRVKDLFDIILFIKEGVKPEDVATVLPDVFRIAGNTPIPSMLSDPPTSWRSVYESMAEENNLDIRYDAALVLRADFYVKILSLI